MHGKQGASALNLSPDPELKKPTIELIAGFLLYMRLIGRMCEIRTRDQRIKSPLLYQLS